MLALRHLVTRSLSSSVLRSPSHYTLTLSLTLPLSSRIPVRTIITTNPDEVKLNNLRDNAGALKHGVRIGRGIGTGRGKTSKRGHKGQKARTGKGKPMPGMTGGGLPLYRSVRKFGFKNAKFKRDLNPFNLDVLQHHIANGTINPYKTIGVKEIFDSLATGKKIVHGIKLLARGADQLTTKNLHLQVTDCSTAAREAIEKLGGKVDLVYHNKLALRFTTKPEKFFFKPTFARPPPKLHATKYPNFPEPTPATSSPQVLEDLDYEPDFDDKRRAEMRAVKEKVKKDKVLTQKKKTTKQEKKDTAIANASKKVTKTAKAQ